MLTRREFLKKAGAGVVAFSLSSFVPFGKAQAYDGNLALRWDAYAEGTEPDYVAAVAQDRDNPANFEYVIVPGDINYANIPSEPSVRYHARAFAFKFQPDRVDVSGWSAEEPASDPNLKGNFTNAGGSADFVDASDYSAIRALYGKVLGDPEFKPEFDIDNDGQIGRTELYAPREQRNMSQAPRFTDNANTDFRFTGNASYSGKLDDWDYLRDNYDRLYWDIQSLYEDYLSSLG